MVNRGRNCNSWARVHLFALSTLESSEVCKECFGHLFESSALRSHKSSLDLGQLARALRHLSATVWPIGHHRTIEPGSGLRVFELLWLSHWRWKQTEIHWVDVAYVKTCPNKMWQTYIRKNCKWYFPVSVSKLVI